MTRVLINYALAFVLCSCATKSSPKESLAMIQIYDRNGFQETITNRERLERYEKNDFMQTQPYERVVRTFAKNQFGQTPGRITSYHRNGGIYQLLETIDGRANGFYREWHPNGQLRMEAKVIEGRGDLSDEAITTWVFDGVAWVHDDLGNLEAKIPYDRGMLVDVSKYYYPSGQLKEIMPYQQGKLHGKLIIYRENGEDLAYSNFVDGAQEGICEFLGSEESPPYREVYAAGKLLSGIYYDFNQQILSKVDGGSGVRSQFENGQIKRQEEIKNGKVEGQIAIFNAGVLESRYHLVEGKKHGEEWIYYPPKSESFIELEPKMLIDWSHGEVHGRVKTWYSGGRIESHREMVRNEKHGFYTCWYGDGSMMLVEEYDQGKLISGKYYKKGDPIFVSQVEKGCGVATFHDYDGYYKNKVTYLEGRVVGRTSKE